MAKNKKDKLKDILPVEKNVEAPLEETSETPSAEEIFEAPPEETTPPEETPEAPPEEEPEEAEKPKRQIGIRDGKPIYAKD